MIGLILLVISLIIAGIGLYRSERMLAARRQAALDSSSRQLEDADADIAQLDHEGDGAMSLPAQPPVQHAGDGHSSVPADATRHDRPALERSFPSGDGAVPKVRESGSYVLVVDLDQKVRERLTEMLSRDYEIREAHDAAAAVALMSRERPRVAIVGSNVRDRHGRAFWEWMRRSEALGSVPLMLVSALTAHEDVSERFDHLPYRPSAVLRKPLLLDEVRRTLSRLLDARDDGWTADAARFSRSSDEDDRFVRRAQEEVERRISQAAFGVRELSEELGLSARQLQRRLRDTTGLSPNAFIRSIRLQRAARMLEGGSEPVSQVAYAVGFNSLSYFAKCFREHFGRNPSEFTLRRSRVSL